MKVQRIDDEVAQRAPRVARLDHRAGGRHESARRQQSAFVSLARSVILTAGFAGVPAGSRREQQEPLCVLCLLCGKSNRGGLLCFEGVADSGGGNLAGDQEARSTGFFETRDLMGLVTF